MSRRTQDRHNPFRKSTNTCEWKGMNETRYKSSICGRSLHSFWNTLPSTESKPYIIIKAFDATESPVGIRPNSTTSTCTPSTPIMRIWERSNVTIQNTMDHQVRGPWQLQICQSRCCQQGQWQGTLLEKSRFFPSNGVLPYLVTKILDMTVDLKKVLFHSLTFSVSEADFLLPSLRWAWWWCPFSQLWLSSSSSHKIVFFRKSKVLMTSTLGGHQALLHLVSHLQKASTGPENPWSHQLLDDPRNFDCDFLWLHFFRIFHLRFRLFCLHLLLRPKGLKEAWQLLINRWHQNGL